MSAKNITTVQGDGGTETTIAFSSDKDLGSLGVKTSDSTEPRPSSSTSSAVPNIQDPTLVRTGVQTRSTSQKQSKYETASAEVESFKRLHKIIYGIVNDWAKHTTDRDSEFYMIWVTKWQDNITAKQTFSSIKTRLNIQTIENYFDHVILCPGVQQKLDIRYDSTTHKIKYRKIHYSAPEDKVMGDVFSATQDHRSSYKNAPDDTGGLCVSPEDLPAAVSDNTSPTTSAHRSMVTKHMEFSPFQDISEPSETQKAIRAYIHLSYPTAIQLLESDPNMFLETTCDNHSFPIFHRMIYELIQFWAKTDVAKYYPFYEIWEAWEGVISSASHFRAMQHWMQIITLQDYMDAVRQCPYIADNLVMEWDKNQQCIKWKTKHHPQQTAFDIPQSYRDVVNKVNLSEPSDAFSALLNDFQDEDESAGTIHTNRFIHFLQDKINGIMGHWGNQIKNAEQRLDTYITKLDTSFQDLENRFAQFRSVYSATIQKTNEEVAAIDAKVSFYLARMQERADTCVSRIRQASGFFDSQLTRISTDHLKQFTTTLDTDAKKSMMATIESLIKQHMEEQIEQLDQQATEMLVNMEETFQDYLTQLKTCKSNNPVEEPAPPRPGSTMPSRVTWNRPVASRFAHIAAAHPEIVNPVHKDTSTALFPPPDTMSSYGPTRDPWGRTSQSPTKGYQPTTIPVTPPPRLGTSVSPVQPLNHTHFINRAQFQFTGRVFTFYTQIYNSGPQYGVYLVPLDDVSNDQSLCPYSINGHIFTDQEYRAMAATLYEKLARTDVISMSYTDLRNIIDRYADLNDGYLILREMLEDNHPGMKQDPIYRAPNSAECDGNLQEYTTRFINWLTAERLNDRYFSEKEQVLHYLAGLDDEFDPAVQYVNTLLDTWSHTGINPKCAIRSLPKTIQGYLDKQHGNAVIRTAKGSTNDQTAEMLQEIRAQLETLKHTPATDEYAMINYAKDHRKQRGGWKNPNKGTSPDLLLSSDGRKSVDIFCDACGGHGHPWAACDYTAKLLKAIDYIASLDPASRKTVLDNYHKEQTRRRQWKQMATAGRARQLRDSGDTDGLFDLMQEYQSYLDFSQAGMPWDTTKDNDE